MILAVGKSLLLHPSANAKSTLKAEKENVDPDPGLHSKEAGGDAGGGDVESSESYGDELMTSESEESQDSDSQSTEDRQRAPIPSLPPSPPLNKTTVSKVIPLMYHLKSIVRLFQVKIWIFFWHFRVKKKILIKKKIEKKNSLI